MRAEIALQEDTTTRYLRWEIVFEGSEVARLKALGGPVILKLPATHYVDDAGKYFPSTEVEVPIYPHPGRRNQAQAKFTDFEARRAFMELLQRVVVGEVADFVAESAPGSVPIEGRIFQPAAGSTPR
jgi:hypothetical protein